MSSEIVHIKRSCNLKNDLPKGQTAFLFGPRKSGKTTYLKLHYPEAKFYNLLNSDEYFRLMNEPYLLREDILAMSEEELEEPIIIDEVQKIPILLDEVHSLIESTKAYFILCGSSARKLKKSGANLLGGRAWSYKFFPLVSPELEELDLLKIFNRGLIPSHYLSARSDKFLKAYVEDYLKEEIKEEGLVRNLADFSKFFNSLAFSQGELTNYSNIARDCGIDSKTVKEYYQILVDTLLGFYVEPYVSRSGRASISKQAKFYLFDIGLANHIAHKRVKLLKGVDAGKSLEHFIATELRSYLAYNDLDYEIKFWRARKGHFEVDFIITELGKPLLAIEVKIGRSIKQSDIKGLLGFKEENPDCAAIVVSQDHNKRKMITQYEREITIYPWRTFLKDLWGGNFFN